jgi:hypothetical protein
MTDLIKYYFSIYLLAVGKGGEGGRASGLYLRALCQGLDHVLAPYREALLELEQQLLEDPHLTPSHVQSHLEQVHVRSC